MIKACPARRQSDRLVDLARLDAAGTRAKGLDGLSPRQDLLGLGQELEILHAKGSIRSPRELLDASPSAIGGELPSWSSRVAMSAIEAFPNDHHPQEIRIDYCV